MDKLVKAPEGRPVSSYFFQDNQIKPQRGVPELRTPDWSLFKGAPPGLDLLGHSFITNVIRHCYLCFNRFRGDWTRLTNLLSVD